MNFTSNTSKADPSTERRTFTRYETIGKIVTKINGKNTSFAIVDLSKNGICFTAPSILYKRGDRLKFALKFNTDDKVIRVYLFEGVIVRNAGGFKYGMVYAKKLAPMKVDMDVKW